MRGKIFTPLLLKLCLILFSISFITSFESDLELSEEKISARQNINNQQEENNIPERNILKIENSHFSELENDSSPTVN